MNRKELISTELNELSSLSSTFMDTVEKTLSSIRKEPVKLYLSVQDKYRLLVLRSWVIKYKVSLKYILTNILPFWEAFVSKRSKYVKGKGLNVRVSTLTGKKSEEILKQCIVKDFPNSLNIQIWKTAEQERIYKRSKYLSELNKLRLNNGIKVKVKPATTLNKYVKDYKYSIYKETKRREKIENLFTRYQYRDNPFL